MVFSSEVIMIVKMLTIFFFLNPLGEFFMEFYFLDISSLTPQNIKFHLSGESDIFNLINPVLLILKYSVYDTLKNNGLVSISSN